MSLLNLLKTNPNTRKVFGRKELAIIEKQLFGINLTQSEKNRLSRDIRKKFEFIEKAAYLSAEFGLKKGSIIKALITDAKGAIFADPFSKMISKIILYGSAVENKLTYKSDIDIAVVFSAISVKDATLFRKRLSGKVDERIDLQVYNVLPTTIKWEIDNNGEILYECKD